jgi:hypothetical protein
MGLERDENHVYTLDGRRLPGVTAIMREVIGGPIYATQFHLDRGSANHACYAIMGRGESLGDYDIDPECEGWIEGWKKWENTYGPVGMYVELAVASRMHWYAGTLDLIAEIEGKLTVVDYKNSANKNDSIQMAAYAIAYEEQHGKRGEVKQLMAVQIDGSGEYKVGEYVAGQELRQAAADWLAVRRVHRIKTGE